MSLSAPAQAVRGTRTNSLDQLDFQERRQLIASSLSLTDFLHVGAKEVAAVAGQSSTYLVASTPNRIPNNSFAKLDSRMTLVRKVCCRYRPSVLHSNHTAFNVVLLQSKVSQYS